MGGIIIVVIVIVVVVVVLRGKAAKRQVRYQAHSTYGHQVTLSPTAAEVTGVPLKKAYEQGGR